MYKNDYAINWVMDNEPYKDTGVNCCNYILLSWSTWQP